MSQFVFGGEFVVKLFLFFLSRIFLRGESEKEGRKEGRKKERKKASLPKKGKEKETSERNELVLKRINLSLPFILFLPLPFVHNDGRGRCRGGWLRKNKHKKKNIALDFYVFAIHNSVLRLLEKKKGVGFFKKKRVQKSSLIRSPII